MKARWAEQAAEAFRKPRRVRGRESDITVLQSGFAWV
jgi:hypothetical protein